MSAVARACVNPLQHATALGFFICGVLNNIPSAHAPHDCQLFVLWRLAHDGRDVTRRDRSEVLFLLSAGM